MKLKEQLLKRRIKMIKLLLLIAVTTILPNLANANEVDSNTICGLQGISANHIGIATNANDILRYKKMLLDDEISLDQITTCDYGKNIAVVYKNNNGFKSAMIFSFTGLME